MSARSSEAPGLGSWVPLSPLEGGCVGTGCLQEGAPLRLQAAQRWSGPAGQSHTSLCRLGQLTLLGCRLLPDELGLRVAPWKMVVRIMCKSTWSHSFQ